MVAYREAIQLQRNIIEDLKRRIKEMEKGVVKAEE